TMYMCCSRGMRMTEYHIGEIVSLVFMAAALGMDVFSVSLVIGLQRLRLLRIALHDLIIALFHISLPFIDIVLGKDISVQLCPYTTLAGGLLMVGIGAQMFFSAFNHEIKKIVQPVGVGLLILAFTVSIDSFSVGLSLGISGVKTAITLLMFGATSMILTWGGMLLGRKVRGLVGAYSEFLGGSILCAFGLKILFG